MDNKLHDWQQEDIDDAEYDAVYQQELRDRYYEDNKYEREQHAIQEKVQEITKQIDDISAKIIKNGGSRFFVLRLIELVEKRCELKNQSVKLHNSRSSYYR